MLRIYTLSLLVIVSLFTAGCDLFQSESEALYGGLGGDWVSSVRTNGIVSYLRIEEGRILYGEEGITIDRLDHYYCRITIIGDEEGLGYDPETGRLVTRLVDFSGNPNESYYYLEEDKMRYVARGNLLIDIWSRSDTFVGCENGEGG